MGFVEVIFFFTFPFWHVIDFNINLVSEALGVGVVNGVDVALGVEVALEDGEALGVGVTSSNLAFILFVLKVNPAARKLKIPFLTLTEVVTTFNSPASFNTETEAFTGAVLVPQIQRA